ncbi:UDP-N-acetylglucosamine--undecaprenyl-phosphate N-acetylglucosaminephosphotransferase [Spirabiliibacterium falconis]|uniref:UDP-N-acetylglucosamine--undecaprenyl-phosphate N-acetylglucosaminephosphotransferase n=1 Tax=Spirabiliibacterium falconis TaxID=572023 RepID=UPI001AAD22C0|nr:UDP-N-acetylglucosamine--undecaprenyl-phosphate N-acetylglucosaminephosphotransferase [Spirabiliibacterium falconis]MBE2895261.1 UDP-N-acetylglucosamine--undecaprenyl-phosphate N-acetylglucosaminephosphotransferase [Spirabiliibacterium falconis]
MWLSLLLPFVVSFVALIVVRPLARRIGLVDKPNYRKRHQGAVPLIGGIALFLGNLCFYLLQWHEMNFPQLYVFCVSVLLFIGVLDDRFDISPFIRAAIQVGLACLMIYYANLSLSSLGQIIGPFKLQLGIFSSVVTVMIIMGVINAFNMIDGIDGLLSGLSSVTFGAIAILMLLDNQINLALWCIVLIMVMLPYALFNLNVFGVKNKVFMGDSGSTLIGFTIIWILLLSTQGSGHPINPVTALWVIAIPLIDMVAVIVRRLRQGKSPFRPDRLHIHHLMMRAGLSSRQALFVITFMAALFAGFGILGEVYYIDEWIMFPLFIILFFVYYYSITRAWRVSRLIKRMRRRASRAKNRVKLTKG